MILFVTMVFAAISMINVKVSFLIIISIYFVFFAKLKPWLSLILFIMVIPLSNTYLLNFRVGNVPGLDLANLLLVCAVVMYLISDGNIKLSFGEVVLVALIVLIHGISFTRSIPYLYYINEYYGTNMGISKYIMSHFLKPITYILPFILIIGYVRTRYKVILFNKFLVLSILISSIVIIGVYITNIPDKTNWDHVRKTIGAFFGLQSNDIASFYILTYPLVLANFIHKKNFYSISCLLLTLTSVALLYSRTAYVLVAFTTIALFLVEKRKKWFLAFCMGLVLLFSFSATTVKERIVVGLEEGDIQTISAGRVDQIWPNVLKIIKKEPLSILFGEGRYAIIYKNRIQKGHPHNMYLEAILDAGVIGLFGFLCFFGYVIGKFLSGTTTIKDEYLKLVLKSSFISVVVYLISGITGRHFFPDITNSYLWIIMALGLSAIKVGQSKPEHHCLTPQGSLPRIKESPCGLP
jgi:O-antigen ligase